MKNINMTGRFFFASVVAASIGLSSCQKDAGGDNNNTTHKLSYGDSILYLKNQATDYIVYPVESLPGTYSAFPDGIEIDDNTGAINVSRSETGLRYRITHTDPNGNTMSTMVVLSGITYFDKFYNLAQGDSIAVPIYNATASRDLPVNGSVFDEGNDANSGGCSVRTTDARINLAETVRNGVFGTTPQNDVRKDFDIKYRLNDQSGKTLNKLRVRVYYYAHVSDVPADLWETLNDRANQGVFLGTNYFLPPADPNTARVTGIAKPRPPCVIIIGQ